MTTTITLDKLRPRNLDPATNAYLAELERILRQQNDTIQGLIPAEGLTFDTLSVTFDTEVITWDQETF